MKGYIIVFFIFFIFGAITDAMEEFGGIESFSKPKSTSKHQAQQSKKNACSSQVQNAKNTESGSARKRKSSRKYKGKYLRTTI